MPPEREDGDRDVPTSVARIAVSIGLAVLLVLSMMGVVGTAAAIDQVAILSPEQRTVEAAPGETIEIDVTLRSQGGHGGEGVSRVALVAQYHPDSVEVSDIERGPWLEGEESEIRTTETIAHEEGRAALEQRREPAAGGTSGSGTIATLTVQVAADAPAGTTTISFNETDVTLTGDWPIAVVDESVTIAIDGDDDEAAENGSSGPIPGFTAGLALAAIVLAALLLVAARDRRRE
ncbi:cohesin domain-containing protein [Natrinema soli]|uniref:Cohesin domain-containing protein n=1 Tax=Natrinema soli TaxID=1930624 RepID=A0ABD5SMX9_9EURY|nr:cohesin domain-containing protein [Natrinema soli]